MITQILCRNLQLKKIRRTEKKGTESVMEEKFSVVFWTDFSVSKTEGNLNQDGFFLYWIGFQAKDK